MTTYTMNLTKEEHMQLKLKAVSLGLSIKDYLLSLFKKDNDNKDIIHSFYDFNNETQNAIKESYDPNTVSNLKSYNSINDLINDLNG